MRTELLLGDEAVAQGAIDAGIAGAFSYPGTPATEILEAVQARSQDIWAQWSPNEKVAYEEALGMSFAGKRAIVSMKHVGLNVAADPFVNSALTGANGGLVLAVADDPGMHSSQNEQDSRFYADFAKVPCFEPSSQQECYDMTREAFELSEELKVPVMVRLVTRIAHSRSNVRMPDETLIERRDSPKPLPDWSEWTLVPSNARRQFKKLLSKQKAFQDYSAESPYNKLSIGGKRGIIATGIAYNYVREALAGSEGDSLLKIGCYPVPLAMVRELVGHCEEIVVVEEGYPFVEGKLTGLLGLPSKTVKGKISGPLPADGELAPEIVAAALGSPMPVTEKPIEDLVGRAPQLCKGCPHSDSFFALVDAVAGYGHPILFSDIGCYTLGAQPPFRAVHSCVDMGASIGMAHGAAQAGAFPVLCTIGDSTFTHSGLTPLLSAIRSNANMTVIILDNATTAMTGAQDTFVTGDDLAALLNGIGVRDLHVFEPHRKNHEASVATIRKAIENKGLSVVVARRACIQLRPAKPFTKEPLCEQQGRQD